MGNMQERMVKVDSDDVIFSNISCFLTRKVTLLIMRDTNHTLPFYLLRLWPQGLASFIFTQQIFQTHLLLFTFIKLRWIDLLINLFFNNATPVCVWAAPVSGRTGRSLVSVFPLITITINNFYCYHLIRFCLCLQTLIKVSR